VLCAGLLAAGCGRPPLIHGHTSPAAAETTTVTFSAEQAERGRAIYLEHCVLCHGTNLSNAQFGAPLKGEHFQSRWRGRSVAELFLYTQATMPPERPMSLPAEDYADALAYIIQANGLAAVTADLPADAKELQKRRLPW
jgi:mono/diheme cytochrome c family protein